MYLCVSPLLAAAYAHSHVLGLPAAVMHTVNMTVCLVAVAVLGDAHYQDDCVHDLPAAIMHIVHMTVCLGAAYAHHHNACVFLVCQLQSCLLAT